MLKILLLIAIISAFIYAPPLRKWAEAIIKKHRKLMIYATIWLLILYLMATGHFNWLFALIGVLLVSFSRLMNILLYYAPALHDLWLRFKNETQQPNNKSHHKNMSVEEAYQVLGLSANATKEEIVAAHRKLMQINHPDRGGSDYLAAKINLAKKTLLSQ